MQRTVLAITFSHFFSPIPVFIAENKSYNVSNHVSMSRNASNIIIKFLNYVFSLLKRENPRCPSILPARLIGGRMGKDAGASFYIL